MDDKMDKELEFLRLAYSEFNLSEEHIKSIAELRIKSFRLNDLKDKLTIIVQKADKPFRDDTPYIISRALLDLMETGNEHLINQYIDSL